MTGFVLHPQLAQDSVLVTQLPLSMLRLINDANYPWLILVPKVQNITEVIQLTAEQQSQLWKESALISEVITHLFTPDKLNIAALGNMVAQLHIHHVARYTKDVCWPKPIWGQVESQPYSSKAIDERVQLIKSAIDTRN